MSSDFAAALVFNDGSLQSSSNITSCTHQGTGSYFVNYDSSFNPGPGAQVTAWGPGLIAGLNVFAANTCEVIIQDASGTPTDSGFSFFVPASP